jgi:phosphatidylinositol alpha-1,6-mannosyltransferase
VTRYPDALLAIAGSAPVNSLSESDDEGTAIEQAVRVSGMEEHVLLCGHLPEDLMWSAYREADVFVFPCLETHGDVEGFGMVALEAAAAGLPTAGFRAGGLPDAVVDGATGLLVDQGRYDLLTEAIASILSSGKARYADRCRAHASALDWTRYGEALSAILRGVARHPKPARP